MSSNIDRKKAEFYFKQGMSSEEPSLRSSLLERATQVDPDYAEAFMELGRTYEQLGEVEKAKLAFRKSIALDDDGWARLWLGNLFFSMEEWDAAEREFIEGQKQLPDVAAPLWCQADVYRKRGDLKKSEQLYRAAVQLEPNNAATLARLGRLLLENNKREEGVKYLQMALKEDPTCRVALKWRKQFNVDSEAGKA